MRFCNRRQIHPYHPSIVQVLEFLTSLFQAGLGYSSINAARSALSALLSCKQRTAVGTHPLVTRFLKGTYELRPPTAKYSHIWDASIVLNHLRTEYPINGLSLKQTCQKLVMLIALTTAQRLQTLHLLDTKDLHINKEKAVFLINQHIKQSRPGSKPMQIELQPYEADPRLDVFHLLKQYLQKTLTLRGNETKLFISYKPPHKHVSKDTLARWLKEVLQNSGINVEHFKAHSTRSAAVSATSAKKLPVDKILQVAGWKSEKTFALFYNKPIHTSQDIFARTLIND